MEMISYLPKEELQVTNKQTMKLKDTYSLEGKL